jgi:hypothetical protein
VNTFCNLKASSYLEGSGKEGYKRNAQYETVANGNNVKCRDFTDEIEEMC